MEEIDEEIWKQITDFPNYEVSSKGQVRNIITNTYLKLSKNASGYNRCNLCNDLIDKTQQLETDKEILHWKIISNYIIYKNTNNNATKVLIFYDSFLLNTLSLYLDLFTPFYISNADYCVK